MDLISAAVSSNESPIRSVSDRSHTGASSLPYEILCDVFLKSLPETEEQENRYISLRSASISTPLSISHVCRHWRAVSLSLGELWSYLYLSDFCGPDKQKRMVDIFNTWLERTNGSPLNCRILLYFLNKEAGKYMISTLISRQRQWRDVRFVWDDLKVSPEFTGINLTEMPMLISLSLAFSFNDHNRDLQYPRINIAHSPGLRKLIIEGDFVLETGEDTTHTMIKQCRFEFTSSEVPASHLCLDFMKTAPNLELFRVSTPWGYSPTCSCYPHDMVLRNLQSLYLDWVTDSAIILDKMTAPGLKALYFRTCYEGAEIPLNFFRRSMPPLTFLETKVDDANDLIPILRLLPSLNYLGIGAAGISEWFFQALTVREDTTTGRACSSSGGEILCPELQAFSLNQVDLVGNMDACMRALITMSQSRCRLLGTFRRVRNVVYMSAHSDLASLDPSNWDVRQRLQCSVANGKLLIEGDDVFPYPFESW